MQWAGVEAISQQHSHIINYLVEKGMVFASPALEGYLQNHPEHRQGVNLLLEKVTLNNRLTHDLPSRTEAKKKNKV